MPRRTRSTIRFPKARNQKANLKRLKIPLKEPSRQRLQLMALSPLKVMRPNHLEVMKISRRKHQLKRPNHPEVKRQSPQRRMTPLSHLSQKSKSGRKVKKHQSHPRMANHPRMTSRQKTGNQARSY